MAATLQHPQLTDECDRHACGVDAYVGWMHMWGGCVCGLDAYVGWMRMEVRCVWGLDEVGIQQVFVLGQSIGCVVPSRSLSSRAFFSATMSPVLHSLALSVWLLIVRLDRVCAW